MTIKVVANSTPLIALARVNRFELLRELFGELSIPQAVYSEVVAASKGRSGGEELRNAGWIHCMQVQNLDLVTFLKISLDDGEAEAIALAKEINADLLLIDDADGRNMAESVGIGITGTVGLLLHHYRGHFRECKRAIDELLAQGFRLSKSEYKRIIALIQKDQQGPNNLLRDE